MGPSTRPEPALHHARSRSARRTVTLFTAAGLLVAVSVAAVAYLLAERAARRQAVTSFAASTRAATVALAPSLRLVARGDSDAATALRDQVDALRRSGIIDGVTLRDPRGRLLWADPSPGSGAAGSLLAARQDLLGAGPARSAPGAPHVEAESRGGGSLRASLVVHGDHSEPLVLSFSSSEDGAPPGARSEWLLFAPAALGAVLLLELVQVPLGWRLGRRVDSAEAHVRALAAAGSEAVEAERHRIATHLHDNVVQDLTGLAYELDLARLGAAPRCGADQDVLRSTASGLRESVEDLRRLLVDLVPAPPPGGGLATSLESLGARLADAGVRVTVEAPETEHLPAATAAVLQRCAEEALRNVAAHSRAVTVTIRIGSAEGNAMMTIEDDGCGFGEQVLARRHADGHVGLRALGHLLADAGGSLTATSAPGRGTRLVARVPLCALAGDRFSA